MPSKKRQSPKNLAELAKDVQRVIEDLNRKAWLESEVSDWISSRPVADAYRSIEKSRYEQGEINAQPGRAAHLIKHQ